MIKVKTGDIVVMNGLKDATKWEVVEVKEFLAKIRECGTNYKSQIIDISMIHKVLK
jgi:hypothetical protein